MGYSVDAKLAPPMIVYAYKNSIPRDVIEAAGSVDPSWSVGKSDSGWISNPVLREHDVPSFLCSETFISSFSMYYNAICMN